MSNKTIWTFEIFPFCCNYLLEEWSQTDIYFMFQKTLTNECTGKFLILSFMTHMSPRTSSIWWKLVQNLLSPFSWIWKLFSVCIGQWNRSPVCSGKCSSHRDKYQKNVHMSFQWLQNFRLIMCRGKTCKFKYFLICITKGYLRKLSLVY